MYYDIYIQSLQLTLPEIKQLELWWEISPICNDHSSVP